MRVSLVLPGLIALLATLCSQPALSAEPAAAPPNPAQVAKNRAAVMALADDPDPKLRDTMRAVLELTLAEGERDVPKMMSYVNDDYIEHNPNVAVPGKAGLRARFSGQWPHPVPATGKLAADLIHMVARGDMVVCMFAIPRPDPASAGKTYIVIHYEAYRVEKGKISEHWDGESAKAASTPAPQDERITVNADVPPLTESQVEKNIQATIALSLDPDEGLRNKMASVLEFSLAEAERDVPRMMDYILSNFIDHDPNVADPSKAGLQARLAARWPRPVASTGTLGPDFARIVARGNMVVCLYMIPRPDPANPTKTYLSTHWEVFGMTGGRIGEHWNGDAFKAAAARKG